MSQVGQIGWSGFFLAVAAAAFVGCGGGGAGEAAGSGQLVALVTPGVPGATTGVDYATQFEASFVHPPGVFQVTGGSLPPGLKLDIQSGLLTGYPRQTGNYHFEIGARDGIDPSLPSGRDSNFAEDRKRYDLEVALGPPNILPQTVPTAQYRAGYAYQIDVAGGTKPYTFEKIGGTLPAGLSLGSTGQIGVFPTSAGGNPYTFQVKVTDANGLSDVDTLSLDVVVLPLIILTSDLPEAAVAFPYDVTMQLASSGGGPPIVWSQKAPVAGEVPLSSIGMEISSDGHLRNDPGLTGPTTLGTFNFTLAVRDEALQESSRPYTLKVNPGPVLSTISPNRASAAGPFTVTGLNFQPGAQVIFKPGPTQTILSTTFVNASTLTFKAPVPKPSDGSGGVGVMVRNPDGGNHTKASAFIFPATTIAFGTKGYFASALSSTGLAAADLDGDGRADVVHCGAAGLAVYSGGATSTNGGLILHMNLGGSPPTFGSSTLDTGNFYDVKLADVNSDGRPDVVALGQTSLKVWLNGVSGNPLGTLTVGPASSLPAGISWPSEMSVGRLNSDGILDVAFGVPNHPTKNTNGRVYAMGGTGTGAFTQLDGAVTSIANTYGVNTLTCVDSDGDGRSEVAAGVGKNPYSGPMLNYSVLSTSGLFGSWATRGGSITSPGYGSTTGMATGDFLGNGTTSVVVAMTGAPSYSNIRRLALYSGAGLSTEKLLAAPGSVSKSVMAIDADFDGPIDWVVSTAPSLLLVYKGATQAVAVTLDAAVGSPAVSTPLTGRVASADLDADGKPDIVTTTSFWAVNGMASDHGSTYKTNATGNGGSMGVVFYLNTSN
jgi:hypothetical protein